MKHTPILTGAVMLSSALVLSGCSQAGHTDTRTEPAAVVSELAQPQPTPTPTPAPTPARARAPVTTSQTPVTTQASATSQAPTASQAPATASRTPVPLDTIIPPAMAVPGHAKAVPFRWKVGPATGKGLGASWKPGCPVGIWSLRAVSLTFWSFDGRVHQGVLVLHRDVVKRARAVFAQMYRQKFPLRSVIPVNKFPKASDDASMAADNTSAFNCRKAVAAGRPSWSRHAYGKAIDVNPVENPYLFGTKILPPTGIKYRNRSKPQPGMIRKGDVIHKTFIKAGFRWGGSFSNPDYQHFDR